MTGKSTMEEIQKSIESGERMDPRVPYLCQRLENAERVIIRVASLSNVTNEKPIPQMQEIRAINGIVNDYRTKEGI